MTNPTPVTPPEDQFGDRSIARDLSESVNDVFEKAGVSIPPEKSRAVANLLVGQASSIFQGPLPPPALLREYDTALPGLARQIADMARAEQAHRHRWEILALRNDVFTQSGGLLLGWLLAGACTAAYVALVACHYSALAAAPLLGPPLLAIIKTMLPDAESRPPQPLKRTADRELTAQEGREKTID